MEQQVITEHFTKVEPFPYGTVGNYGTLHKSRTFPIYRPYAHYWYAVIDRKLTHIIGMQLEVKGLNA